MPPLQATKLYQATTPPLTGKRKHTAGIDCHIIMLTRKCILSKAWLPWKAKINIVVFMLQIPGYRIIHINRIYNKILVRDWFCASLFAML